MFRRVFALAVASTSALGLSSIARADEPPSSALAPPEPPAPPAAGAEPPKAKSQAEQPPPDFPVDAFVPTADDPRIPNFLRALRLGQDSLLLGAYFQPGFRYVVDTDFNDDDAEGFEFGNARLIGRGDLVIYEKFGVSARFDFDVNNGNFAVRDVYGTFYWDKDLIALDVGQLKTPFSLAELQSESKLQFPIASQIRKLSFGRDLGVKLRSDFNPVGDLWLHLSAMMANGDGGFRQRRNLDNAFSYSGRLEIAPLGRMQLSEPDLEDSKPQLTIGASAGHNEKLGNDLGVEDVGSGETRVEGDARFWWKGLSVRGEYLHGFRDDNGENVGYQRYGGAAQLGYVLPFHYLLPPTAYLPRFELVARFEQVDINDSLDGTEGEDYVVDNTTLRNLQFGANVYFAKHAAKVHFLYQLTDLLEGPMTDANGDVLIGDTIFIYTQVAWL